MCLFPCRLGGLRATEAAGMHASQWLQTTRTTCFVCLFSHGLSEAHAKSVTEREACKAWKGKALWNSSSGRLTDPFQHMVAYRCSRHGSEASTCGKESNHGASRKFWPWNLILPCHAMLSINQPPGAWMAPKSTQLVMFLISAAKSAPERFRTLPNPTSAWHLWTSWKLLLDMHHTA